MGSAASLPGEVLNAWCSLRRLQQGRGQENPLEASIKARLQKQVDHASERYKRSGIAQSTLAGAITEMEVALTELSGDDAAVLEAVRFPDNFETYLRRRTADRRQNVEAAAEPFFNDLTRIVANEFIYRAPGSRAFDIAALKQLLVGQEQLLAGQERLIDQYTKTYERLDRIIDSIDNIRNIHGRLHAAPTRIHFGSHPMVTTNFIPRTGQNQLVNAIFSHNEPRIVLTGMRGSGKTSAGRHSYDQVRGGRLAYRRMDQCSLTRETHCRSLRARTAHRHQCAEGHSSGDYYSTLPGSAAFSTCGGPPFRLRQRRELRRPERPHP